MRPSPKIKARFTELGGTDQSALMPYHLAPLSVSSAISLPKSAGDPANTEMPDIPRVNDFAALHRFLRPQDR